MLNPVNNIMKEFIFNYQYSWGRYTNIANVCTFNSWFFYTKNQYLESYGEIKNRFIPYNFEPSFTSILKLQEYYRQHPEEWIIFKQINSSKSIVDAFQFLDTKSL